MNITSSVVVTGLGIVSPAGNDVATFWRTIRAGESCLRPLTRFDTTSFMVKTGGEVRDFSLSEFPRAAASQEDLAVQYLLSATEQALRQAGLTHEPDIAIVAGTNFAGAATGEQIFSAVVNDQTCDRLAWKKSAFQRGADAIAETWGLTGRRLTLSLSCSSGSAAVSVAADLIRTGQAEIVIAAGFDALSTFVWSGLGALRTMAQDTVRPFDINRDGTLFSEGGGVIILESGARAAARGAVALAEYAGGATNNNAFHITAPAKEGAGSAEVMRAALADAGLRAAEIDHVNAHGTGTVANDVTETQAIREVFGAHTDHMPVTALKSGLGHMLGAAGAAEAIASILTVIENEIPPTINCSNQDPACDLRVVKNTAARMTVDRVLSNSAGIGGCNSAVIFTKPGLTLPRGCPKPRRVVITGIGPVSSIGVGKADFFEGLAIGDDGVGACLLYPEDRFADMAVGEVVDFVLKDYFSKPKGYLDRATQFAFAGAALALRDAGLSCDGTAGNRRGIALGTETGCLETAGTFYADYLTKGPRFVKPILFPHTYVNTSISMLAIEYGLRGPHVVFASGAAAGPQAILAAVDQIRLGRADMMLTGGVEALSREWLTALSAEGALADDGVSAPFDRAASGLVPGEGAAILVLEDFEHAAARGARIYGEFTDGQTGTDAVFSCANGCPETDTAESAAIAKLVRESGQDIPVTAVKSMTGETGGASAAFHIMAGLMAMETGVMPPTLNTRTPRDGAEFDLVTDLDRACEARHFTVSCHDGRGQSDNIQVSKLAD
ncbi:MAG: beta-ketoacyl-[acyl-carrier-protein] synthase family protein [Lentisphaeria bacterium]|nr:beta-ketoacyl-[acyl-carrier-protein] synthase family protein [Lentisphaeria bacterium]